MYNIIYYVETKILIFSSLVSNMMADGNQTTFLNIYFKYLYISYITFDFIDIGRDSQVASL